MQRQRSERRGGDGGTGLLATLLLGALAACGDATQVATVDAAAVRACFDAYRDAIERKDGEAAADHVSVATFAMFGSLRDLAMVGDRETVAALPVYRKIQVLALRVAIAPAALAEFDEREVFEDVVAQGFLDATMLHGIELGAVDGEGNHAVALVVEGGEVTDQGIRFVREEGRWKVDLLQALGDSDRFEKAQSNQSGMREDDYVLERVRAYTGRPVAESVWKPLVIED